MRCYLSYQALQAFPSGTFRPIHTWLFGALCPVLCGTARPLTASVLCLFGGWRPVSPSFYRFPGRWCPFVYYYGRRWPSLPFCGFHGPIWPPISLLHRLSRCGHGGWEQAVPSKLHLPCNLGIHCLLALTASAFAVSGRFQPFLESWRCSLLSSACLSQHRSFDCVYSP